MNAQRFEGICRQFAGMLTQAWGELSGDSLRADAGRRDRIFGKTQERSGIAIEESARQLKDFLQRNRNWHI